MNGRVAVVDTSVLISLQCTDTIGAATVLFDRLLIPVKVRAEVKAGGDRNHSMELALRSYAIFEDCNDFDPASVDFLLQDRAGAGKGRDRGEAEAVVQAAARNANMVLIDDALGRSWAARHRIECHGTLWLLNELRTRGFLVELRPLFQQLIRSGRRQPIAEINAILLRHGEQQL